MANKWVSVDQFSRVKYVYVYRLASAGVPAERIDESEDIKTSKYWKKYMVKKKNLMQFSDKPLIKFFCLSHAIIKVASLCANLHINVYSDHNPMKTMKTIAIYIYFINK